MTIFRTPLAFLVGLLGLLLAAPVIVVALPFWLVAYLTNTIARFIEPRYLSWQQLIAFDPSIGWRPKPDLDAYYLATPEDDLYHVKTDSQGWPDTISAAESDVIIFGDSFAFGYGVDSRASFFALDPNLRAKAIGAPGYNMVQELLLMRQFSAQLKGKLVVWLICVENDLIENIMPDMANYRTPFVGKRGEEGEWKIVTRHLSPAKWRSVPRSRPYFEILAHLCGPTPVSERAYSACEFLIKQGRAVCDQAGARLAVMTIPNAKQLSDAGVKFLTSRARNTKSIDPGFPDQQIGAICRGLGIPFVALKDHLKAEDYKDHDPHWTEAGNRRVAKVLAGLYRDYLSGRMDREITEGRSREPAKEQPPLSEAGAVDFT